MRLTDKLFSRVPKKQNVKMQTTSFTLTRVDYVKFAEVCKKNDRTPSDVLRGMVLIFIDENK